MSKAFGLFNGIARPVTARAISFPAYCALVRLWASAPCRDVERAREAQINAANRGESLAQIAAIYREEMAYLPSDKVREEASNGSWD